MPGIVLTGHIFRTASSCLGELVLLSVSRLTGEWTEAQHGQCPPTFQKLHASSFLLRAQRRFSAWEYPVCPCRGRCSLGAAAVCVSPQNGSPRTGVGRRGTFFLCVCVGGAGQRPRGDKDPASEHGGWSGGLPLPRPPSSPVQPPRPRTAGLLHRRDLRPPADIFQLHLPEVFVLATSLLTRPLLQTHFQRNENRVHQGEKTQAFFFSQLQKRGDPNPSHPEGALPLAPGPAFWA